MNEMVERVAIAFCGTGREEWDDPDFERYQYIYRARARAAILAMREPTEAMVNAGLDNAVCGTRAGRVWRAMVDEALK